MNIVLCILAIVLKGIRIKHYNILYEKKNAKYVVIFLFLLEKFITFINL